ncbi:AMP-binding protein, partial [Ferroglobus sp.]|uniref:AMP-binding protein n=1 Tax=Ferroglobus sp. TaxID=2614230 RepID=UPI0025BB136E
MEFPWYKHYPKHVPKSLEYPERNLFENLKISAKKFPENYAVVYKDFPYTYEKLLELSNKFANFLLSFGIKKGDRVALYLPNIPQFVIAYYGALASGGVVVACNALYKEKEVEYILSDSKAKVVVTLDDMKEVVENVRESTEVEEIISTSRSEALNGFTSGRFSELLKEHPAEDPGVKINPKEDLAVLQYTGGTTGKPKGAMLTHYNLLVIQV